MTHRRYNFLPVPAGGASGFSAVAAQGGEVGACGAGGAVVVDADFGAAAVPFGDGGAGGAASAAAAFGGFGEEAGHVGGGWLKVMGPGGAGWWMGLLWGSSRGGGGFLENGEIISGCRAAGMAGLGG